MSDWTTSKLSDVIEIIGGGTPKRSENKYWNGDIPWLSVADFNNDFRYVNDSIEHITELGLQKSSTKLLDKDHLIISARGTVGCLAQLSVPMAFNQSCYGLNGKEGILDNGFLYYFLKNNISELKQKTHGAVFDTITRDTFEHIQISYPDLGTQKEIAKNLGNFDDKIQLNTQINQTLEQIAQALFKSWFIDFDPVRAKVQALSDGLSLEQAELAAMQAISGKTAEELTALSQTQPDRYAELAETAKAFPCEMVEVDGVEVPKGWDTLSFKDFIKEKKEKVGNLKNVPEYSVTNNGIIPRSQKFNKQLSKDPEKNKLLHKTDLVFGISREVLNWGIMEDEIGAVSSAYHIYSINKDKVNYLYLKMLMQNRFEYFNELIRPSSREGQGFDKELLKEKKVTIPCNILLDKFLHDLNTIKSQMNNITQETESLIFIRNLLLPKLLNGEI